MPFVDVPAFIGTLRAMQGVAPRALEFTILTAARSGEVLGARWEEIDLQGKVWTVPAERMKAGNEHRVPLSDRALAILKELHRVRTSGFVFPGFKRGLPLSNMALEAVLRRAKIRCHNARLPLVIPGLGGRSHGVCPRRCRGRTSTCDRE
jgi:integrase